MVCFGCCVTCMHSYTPVSAIRRQSGNPGDFGIRFSPAESQGCVGTRGLCYLDAQTAAIMPSLVFSNNLPGPRSVPGFGQGSLIEADACRKNGRPKESSCPVVCLKRHMDIPSEPGSWPHTWSRKAVRGGPLIRALRRKLAWHAANRSGPHIPFAVVPTLQCEIHPNSATQKQQIFLEDGPSTEPGTRWGPVSGHGPPFDSHGLSDLAKR